MKCTVEIFGLPDDITRLSKVTVEVADGADLRQLITALRGAIPALEGPVVSEGEDRLDPRTGSTSTAASTRTTCRCGCTAATVLLCCRWPPGGA